MYRTDQVIFPSIAPTKAPEQSDVLSKTRRPIVFHRTGSAQAAVSLTNIRARRKLARGPTAWDRLLAYNSAANRVTGVLAISAVVLHQPVLLDVAIVYAALSFIGVVALARFMERGEGFR